MEGGGDGGGEGAVASLANSSRCLPCRFPSVCYFGQQQVGFPIPAVAAVVGTVAERAAGTAVGMAAGNRICGFPG